MDPHAGPMVLMGQPGMQPGVLQPGMLLPSQPSTSQAIAVHSVLLSPQSSADISDLANRKRKVCVGCLLKVGSMTETDTQIREPCESSCALSTQLVTPRPPSNACMEYTSQRATQALHNAHTPHATCKLHQNANHYRLRFENSRTPPTIVPSPASHINSWLLHSQL